MVYWYETSTGLTEAPNGNVPAGGAVRGSGRSAEVVSFSQVRGRGRWRAGGVIAALGVVLGVTSPAVATAPDLDALALDHGNHDGSTASMFELDPTPCGEGVLLVLPLGTGVVVASVLEVIDSAVGFCRMAETRA